MPYIKQQRRSLLDHSIYKIAREIRHPGELNYAISKLLKMRLKSMGVNYANLNELMGVLSCVQSEFYRRIVVPYEDKKIEEHGDI